MTIDPNNLIPLARLSYHEEDDGWLRWVYESGAISERDPENVFLFFSKHKVWYVTIADIQCVHGKRLVRFVEDDVLPEVKANGRVSVMLAPEDAEEATPIPELEGKPVWFAGEPVGIVTDYFHNGAQWVLVCDNGHGGEFMVPFVDEFIDSTNDERITLRNAAELLTE